MLTLSRFGDVRASKFRDESCNAQPTWKNQHSLYLMHVVCTDIGYHMKKNMLCLHLFQEIGPTGATFHGGLLVGWGFLHLDPIARSTDQTISSIRASIPETKTHHVGQLRRNVYGKVYEISRRCTYHCFSGLKIPVRVHIKWVYCWNTHALLIIGTWSHQTEPAIGRVGEYSADESQGFFCIFLFLFRSESSDSSASLSQLFPTYVFQYRDTPHQVFAFSTKKRLQETIMNSHWYIKFLLMII